MTEHEREQHEYIVQERGRWWDRHFSAGSILNLVAVVFLAGGFYFWTQTTLQDHGDRIAKIEDLQIRMAEVILRQSHFSEQLNRVEDRMKERYNMLAHRLDNMEANNGD